MKGVWSMPLTITSIGQSVRVKKINGADSTKHFLQTLGFTEGEEVTIVSKIGGNMIVHLKNTRIALDTSMANRVIVG